MERSLSSAGTLIYLTGLFDKADLAEPGGKKEAPVLLI